MQNGGNGTRARAVWNTAGALGAAAVALVGVYFLIEVLKPLVGGEQGAVGYAIVGITIVVVYVGLFLLLRWLAPKWVASGENRFPG
ncbi:MAG: hypothetical protein F4045_12600 [Chloroflexi bacterium]|nr:hypothetical protein [Chloroflexota bacterium]